MRFTIDSDEGLPIRGDLDVPDNPRALVVVVHGFKGFKDWGFFPWLARHLTRHRFAVCRFNMSRSGIGDDPETFERLDLFAGDTFSIQLADLRAAVSYAQSQIASLPTFLLGHSRGGGVAILGASDVPMLRGVVVWSSIAQADRWDDETKRQWRASGSLDVVNQRTKQVMRMAPSMLDDVEANRERLDIIAALERIRRPVLAVHGGRDESVPVGEGRLIASRASDPALVVIEKAGHTFNAVHPLVQVPFELMIAGEVSAHFISAHL